MRLVYDFLYLLQAHASCLIYLNLDSQLQQPHIMALLYLQLVATLHGCSAAICDKVKQSAEGAIQAVVEFVIKRGNELMETDISRFCSFPIFLVAFFCFLFFSHGKTNFRRAFE